MAKRPDIQYIQFYVDGSAAKKLEPVAPVKEIKTLRIPAIHEQKTKVLHIDPVATIGLIVAVCMLSMMLFGVVQLKNAKLEAQAMEQLVSELVQENSELSKTYLSSYNLSDIESKALALGMVPASQVQQTTIHIYTPAAEEQPISLWEQVGTLLAGLFA